MYTEMKEMITVGVSDYLSSPWTYLELLNFFLSLTAIATQMARILIVDHFLDRLVRQGFESYVSFSVPQFLDEILALLRSLIFVLVTLKVFKVLRFNRHFRVLLQSFYIARFSIVNQAMIAFILFMAFGIASLILFGSHLEDYYNLSSTLLALLNFGLGEGDFEGMHESQPVLGPVLYFLFIIVFSTITMSFFVTFILESFTVSRVYVQLNAEEQHVLRYVVRTWRLMVGATPQIRQVRRRRRTHPFKAASFSPKHLMFPDDEPRGQ
ncbi:polycystin-2-like protein 2 [Babylonia areolata]|uniref:polycystin-2-like protein 2 n=1 Tax=Babylonia areolata TaxID=304850 RepID=UPI003FD61FB6